MRLCILASHPVQYQTPLFREIARRMAVEVLFAHDPNGDDQARAGFGIRFAWDVDLLDGFGHKFLENVAHRPGVERFSECDTPSIASAIRHGSFDACLVMGWYLKSYWQGIWAAKRAGIPVIVRGDSHLNTPRNWLKRVSKEVIYPRILRAFDRALYVGARSREYWEYYRYPRERLFFSPHCIDTDWFSARATASERARFRADNAIGETDFVILFAGKLLPFKRPLDVIEACACLKAAGQDVTVMFAGAGPLEPKVRSEALRHGVRTVYLGFCNQSRMPSAYAAADVLVLPSNGRETWGLVANEAQACGLPIIVSDSCGCAPDLASDNVAGRIFRTGDIADLASRIVDVFENRPSFEIVAAKSRDYSVERAVDGIEAALGR